MGKNKRHIMPLLFIILSILILVACKRGDSVGSKKPVVYTSFYPIKELVSEIAGDTLEVRSFMPENKEPHLWEPTPRDMRKLLKSDMLITNGANMESWMPQVQENAPDLEVVVLSDNVELITYKGAAALGDFQYMVQHQAEKGEKFEIEFGHTHEDIMRIVFIENNDNKSEEELIKLGKNYMNKKGNVILQGETIDVEEGQVYSIEMGHESGNVFYKLPKSGSWIFISDRMSEDLLSYDLKNSMGEKTEIKVLREGSTTGLDKITYDPHSWMSIINAKKYLNKIYEVLAEKYPENKAIYRKNKVDIVSKLTDLEYEYKEKFNKLKIKTFVVTHNAYAYLCRDFGLDQYPLQGLVSTETPSLKTLKKAIDYCIHYGIKTIFYEYGGQKKGADTVASELGGNSVPLASMEYNNVFKDSDSNGYYEVMKMNLENLYKAMEELK
ncbi:MAG: zinc ABC transporter substrate-binding protein [Tissierellia bacterium]|nr:zinc ABC transporter substrate-binding protein [Tissierellia bacterium]